MPKVVFFLFVSLLSAVVSHAQATEISGSEVSTRYQAALDKARQISRLHTSKLDSFRGGKGESKEWLTEYVEPYRRRFVYRETSEKGVSGFEEINIDEATYCRTLEGVWKRSAATCMTGKSVILQASYQILGKGVSRHTVDNVLTAGKNLRLYRKITEYTIKVPINPDVEVRRVVENSYWLDEESRIVREETRNTAVGAKQPSSVWIDTFVYSPSGLKIEPPIK